MNSFQKFCRIILLIPMITICVNITHGCAHSRYKSMCLNSQQSDVYDRLIEMEGQEICIRGPVSLEPHGVYFQTNNAAGDSLYGGKIYLPISYADTAREGLDDGDIFEFTGVLEIRKSSNCSLPRCFVYYLRK